ncbi:MAG TPA: 6-phosphogluconolactonase [Planctomycetota bacterium]|nr:6-phosphogluconolactonase [Planctomycetota bacterium]
MNFVRNVFTDAGTVARQAADAIVNLAQQRVKAGGRFSVALAGGSTPRAAYTLLSVSPLIQKMPWEQTKIYFGDERLVPHTHADSNYRMAYDALLKAIPPAIENVFPIPTDNDDVSLCAEFYEDLLRVHFQRRTDNLPGFDLILLGIGADGHTASLFPGTPAASETQKWVTWCDPASTNPNIKPAVKRITITAPVIWNAANVIVMATGAEKAAPLAKVFSENEPADPPIARLLRKCKGQVTFFMDREAGG